MNIIRFRNVFFVLAGILIVLSLVGIFAKGFDWGVDFTGGSVLQVEYKTAPDIAKLSENVHQVDPEARVQAFGTTGLVVRSKPLTLEQKDLVMERLVVEGNSVSEKQFNTVGPTVGKDLRAQRLREKSLMLCRMVCSLRSKRA
jgi:preprotein translocase subunit SecF